MTWGLGWSFLVFASGTSLPGAFIFEKTKNEAKRTCPSGGVTFKTLKVRGWAKTKRWTYLCFFGASAARISPQMAQLL